MLERRLMHTVQAIKNVVTQNGRKGGRHIECGREFATASSHVEQ